MKREDEIMEQMKKRNFNICMVVIVMTLFFLLCGIFLKSARREIVEINASRVPLTLSECVDEAAAIVEVKMEGIDYITTANGFEQTVHKAEVVNSIKGNLEGTIQILQDGSPEFPFGGEPIFKKGENYLFTLKKASASGLEGTYWAPKQYFVSGDAALELFPEPQNTRAIQLLSEQQGDEKIQNKKKELNRDASVINKAELISFMGE
jgi:hypothetical protein